jgi:hypothetical protein
MRGVTVCSASCKHLRAFRYGFDGSRVLYPWNGKDKAAGCALRPETTIQMRGCPVCWMAEEE